MVHLILQLLLRESGKEQVVCADRVPSSFLFILYRVDLSNVDVSV